MMIHPANGLMARDLALVCHYQGLPLVARPGLAPAARPSVNALSAAFVEVLQNNVPSAVSTIHRTAARLQVRALKLCTAGNAQHFVMHALQNPGEGRVSYPTVSYLEWAVLSSVASGSGAGFSVELCVGLIRR